MTLSPQASAAVRSQALVFNVLSVRSTETASESRAYSEQTTRLAADGHESVLAECCDRVGCAVVVATSVAAQQASSAHTLRAITELAASDLTVSLAV
jgi:hypothetical protein